MNHMCLQKYHLLWDIYVTASEVHLIMQKKENERSKCLFQGGPGCDKLLQDYWTNCLADEARSQDTSFGYTAFSLWHIISIHAFSHYSQTGVLVLEKVWELSTIGIKHSEAIFTATCALCYGCRDVILKTLKTSHSV